jgi:DNA-binding NarL/FixJ family response regulator
MTKELSREKAALQEVYQVLIVDDHPIVREGYAKLIARRPDLEVCGEAADAGELFALVEQTRPDLIIIDISLRNGNGVDLCKQIKERYPEIKMLVISAHDESAYAERVLRAGAMGYVNKGQPAAQLIEAIRRVLSGKLFLSPEMTERMLSRQIGSDRNLLQSPIETLTDREIQVFELIGQGLTTRQVASKLDLSQKTIESYRENLKRKLQLKNGTELNRLAVQWVLENA